MMPQQVAMAGMVAPPPQGTLSYLPPAIQAVTVPNAGPQVPAVAAQVAPVPAVAAQVAPYGGAQIAPAPAVTAQVAAPQYAQAPAVTAQVGAPKSAAEFYKSYTASQNSYLPPVMAAPTAATTVVESFAAPVVTTAPTVVAAPSMVPAPTTVAPAATYASTAYAQPAPAVEFISAPPAVSYSQPAPAVTYASQPVAMPQVSSYIPAPVPAAVETIVQQPTFTETIVPQQAYTTAPSVVTQGAVSYLPPAQPAVMYEQVMGGAFDPAGQSVIVEQIGDWLVCEDAMGLFYHHAPTQQSFDNAPAEFLMMFPQGYQPPPLGAFAQSGMGLNAVPAVSYAQPAPAVMPAVSSYLPPVTAPVVMEQFAAPTTYAAAPTAYAAPQPVIQSAPVVVEQFAAAPMAVAATPSYAPQLPGQMAPMMAKAYY